MEQLYCWVKRRDPLRLPKIHKCGDISHRTQVEGETGPICGAHNPATCGSLDLDRGTSATLTFRSFQACKRCFSEEERNAMKKAEREASV